MGIMEKKMETTMLESLVSCLTKGLGAYQTRLAQGSLRRLQTIPVTSPNNEESGETSNLQRGQQSANDPLFKVNFGVGKCSGSA